MFVSSSHELQLIKGIKWLKSISLQEVHRGLTKHYLLVPALAVKWSNVSRQTGKKRLNKTKTQQIILPKKMINQHLTDIIWYTNEHIKVRNACFFPVTIKPFYRRGGGRTVGAADGVLPGIFCGVCWHQVPRLWTVCPCSGSRWTWWRPAESLHCPLVVKHIPFIQLQLSAPKQAFLHPSMYVRMCTWYGRKDKMLQLRKFLF